MGEQDESTLEFHEEAPMETLTRQAFRIPVSGKDNFNVVQETTSLDLVDVSLSGTSVSVLTGHEWPVDSLVSSSTMNLGEISVPGLEGRVIRCTPASGNSWITGIQWSNMPAESKQEIENLLYSLRQELFETEE